MKGKRGYIKFSLGCSTWYFLDKDVKGLGKALVANDIMTVIELSCLELDELGHCVASDWPNYVSSEVSLANQIKRKRLRG